MGKQSLKKKKQIRVLVVDDSATVREVVSNVLSLDPLLKIVGHAKNGKEAVDMVNRLHPDIITMDIEMPEMGGLEATEQIMAYNPTPIVVLTASLSHKGQDFVYRALDVGAMAVMSKPERLSDLGMEFTAKVKLLSKVPVITHLRGRRKHRLVSNTLPTFKRTNVHKTVGIVSSTGGPDALRRILSALPRSFSSGIIIVQHIGKGFETDLIGWLKLYSNLDIILVKGGEAINPGIVYFAPSERHTIITGDGTLGLSQTPPVWGHRPSGDVMLTSLASVMGSQSIGVILTGMGCDGAQGIQAIKESGGKTIAQDKNSSLIFGMPKSAIDSGFVDRVVHIDGVAQAIVEAMQV